MLPLCEKVALNCICLEIHDMFKHRFEVQLLQNPLLCTVAAPIFFIGTLLVQYIVYNFNDRLTTPEVS